MIKDVQQEEKEKEEKKKEEEKKPGFLEKVPMAWKIGGFLLIIIQYLRLQSQGKNLNEIWFWVGIVLMIWYMFNKSDKQVESDILTPAEADDAFNKEILRLRRSDEIPLSTIVYLSVNKGLQWHEGMPTHYLKGFYMRPINEKLQYMRATINAQGPTKGFVTFQTSLGELQGRETIPVISKFPPWAERLKKEEMLDKFLWGVGEKKR